MYVYVCRYVCLYVCMYTHVQYVSRCVYMHIYIYIVESSLPEKPKENMDHESS